MADTYRITRIYFNVPGKKRTIVTGLTLEEAQAHCRNTETSSRTCRQPLNVRRTERKGPWFDGYERE